MKRMLIIPVLAGVAMLAGCAGTASEFECNATTSDSCMTMEQANEKAKQREETTAVKPGAAALPTLAKGNFAVIGRNGAGADPVVFPVISEATTASQLTARPVPSSVPVKPASSSLAPTVTMETTTLRCTTARCAGVGSTRPLRVSERTAQLWIAPWIDSQDVYHQPGKVVFVVTPGQWGTPTTVY